MALADGKNWVNLVWKLLQILRCVEERIKGSMVVLPRTLVSATHYPKPCAFFPFFYGKNAAFLSHTHTPSVTETKIASNLTSHGVHRMRSSTNKFSYDQHWYQSELISITWLTFYKIAYIMIWVQLCWRRGWISDVLYRHHLYFFNY